MSCCGGWTDIILADHGRNLSPLSKPGVGCGAMLPHRDMNLEHAPPTLPPQAAGPPSPPPFLPGARASLLCSAPPPAIVRPGSLASWAPAPAGHAPRGPTSQPMRRFATKTAGQATRTSHTFAGKTHLPVRAAWQFAACNLLAPSGIPAEFASSSRLLRTLFWQIMQGPSTMAPCIVCATPTGTLRTDCATQTASKTCRHARLDPALGM